MTASYRDGLTGTDGPSEAADRSASASPDVWEIRVVVGFDAIYNRSVQRSFTVHGDATFAEQRRRELVEAYGVTRVDFTTAGARLTVGELMERFLESPTSGSRQPWYLTGPS